MTENNNLPSPNLGGDGVLEWLAKINRLPALLPPWARFLGMLLTGWWLFSLIRAAGWWPR